MKNKKILIITTILLLVIIVGFVLFIKKSNGFSSSDSLLTNLKSAVNNENSNKIIACYPEFIQSSLPQFSENKMVEFHNNVGDISFEITNKNKCDSESILSQQNEINEKYNCNIKLEDYQILTCKYHEGFSETSFELIKIDGKWYLYYSGYLPEPLSYFVE